MRWECFEEGVVVLVMMLVLEALLPPCRLGKEQADCAFLCSTSWHHVNRRCVCNFARVTFGVVNIHTLRRRRQHMADIYHADMRRFGLSSFIIPTHCQDTQLARNDNSTEKTTPLTSKWSNTDTSTAGRRRMS